MTAVKNGATEVSKAVTDDEVKAVLTLLSREATRTAGVRRQAAAALASPTLIHEYTGVLTILLSNLARWQWPAEGIARRIVPLRDKPRLFLDEDLVTALFLQLVSVRWGIQVKAPARKLIAENEREALPSGKLVSRAHPVSLSRHAPNLLLLSMIPATSQDWSQTGGYDQNVLEDQLRLIHAEIRLARALEPDQPLIVVQTDLRDFYPRIPHAALLHLAGRLGFPPVWIEFLRRYLSVPVRTAQGVAHVRRGVPLDHRLGDVLAELFLLLLDLHVLRECGVRLLRVVDDIVFLTHSADTARKTWQTIVDFCGRFGLEINTEKSGSLTLNGPPVPGLPTQPPRWGLLRLEADGWQLDEERFASLQEWMRRQVQGGGSTLGMVRRYNDAVRFLLGSLALSVPLGPNHLEVVSQRIGQLQQNLFGPGHGLSAELRQRLGQHFRDPRLRERPPEALLYWPITAGGLGLVQPLLVLTGYRRTRMHDPVPPARPADPGGPQGGGALTQAEQQRWRSYYQGLLHEQDLAPPTTTPGSQDLVRDFIARGSEVAGRKQLTLRPYWQWVVSTYGPALLESLGTFRFLLTELVPLGLIFPAGSSSAQASLENTGEDELPF